MLTVLSISVTYISKLKKLNIIILFLSVETYASYGELPPIEDISSIGDMVVTHAVLKRNNEEGCVINTNGRQDLLPSFLKASTSSEDYFTSAHPFLSCNKEKEIELQSKSQYFVADSIELASVKAFIQLGGQCILGAIAGISANHAVNIYTDGNNHYDSVEILGAFATTIVASVISVTSIVESLIAANEFYSYASNRPVSRAFASIAGASSASGAIVVCGAGTYFVLSKG